LGRVSVAPLETEFTLAKNPAKVAILSFG